MDRTQAGQVLLVRAAEEVHPALVPAEVAVDAEARAGSARDEEAWLARRAAWITDHALAELRPLLGLLDGPRLALAGFLALAVVLGLLTNSLGPSGRIHVLLNPLSVLVGWNLMVLAALAAGGVVRGRRRRRAPGPPEPVSAGAPGEEAWRSASDASAARHAAPRARRLPRSVRFLLGRALPALWLRLHGAAREARAAAGTRARVARVFWSRWLKLGEPLLAARFRRAVHLAALGVAAGAVAGMFVRGLVFEYDMVWRSTFVREPETAARVLRVALGPACAVLGEPLPDAATAAALMRPEGEPAARWLWLWAVSAGLFIGLPRSALALLAAGRARRAGRRLSLDLDDPYYRGLLDEARRLQLDRLAEAIRADVRVETGRFAEGVAGLVTERLFDAEIVPRVRRFRREGGRVADLEEEIAAACEDFRKTLAEALPAARCDFERGLAHAVNRSVGAEVDVVAAPEVAGAVAGASQASGRAAGGAVGRELADLVGASVSAAVAVAAGTVSGGFGSKLGAAVLVALLGTTGPVGFLLGAVGGLLVAGAAFWISRESLAAGIKRVSLPSLVTRAALRPGRLEHLLDTGRDTCRDAVRERLDAELEPLAPTLAEQIWTRLRPALARRHGHGAGGDGTEPP